MKSPVRHPHPAESCPAYDRGEGGRVTPSWPHRVIGVTNVGFGVFLIVVHLILPAASGPPTGPAWSSHGVKPSLMALLGAVLVSVAGFEKWSGRQEWGLVLASRLAPRSKGDPLVYTLLIVSCWLFWKAFPWVVALVAPVYATLFWLAVKGSL